MLFLFFYYTYSKNLHIIFLMWQNKMLKYLLQ